MKILVLSDIHANIWALRKILETEQNVDKICFAGDMVDYGIAPAEVIEWFKTHSDTIAVKGNHDAYAVKLFYQKDFKNIPSKKYKWIHYNLEKLSEKQIDFLNCLPKFQYFLSDGWAYLITHQYVENTYDTIENQTQYKIFWMKNTPEEFWNFPQKRIIFGHSHRRCVHLLGDKMEWLNPGSVSYRRPDDPDKSAHYMIIQDGKIIMKNLSYDRIPLLKEAELQLKKGRMMDTEIQDFFFFFGNAKTSRDPLPKL